ncbi:MAG: hypothetical protein Q7J48_14115, partial [Nocardioides sp.]|nr:hypothetical protein [Nocardioides sp.]
EHDGHLWQPSSFLLSEPGDRSLRVDSDGDPERPVLAVGYHSARGATVVREHSVTGEGARFEGREGGNSVIGLLSLPTDSVSTRVLGDVPDDAQLMIVLFEQVD